MQKILNYQSISDKKVLHNNIEIEIWNHWKDFEAFKLISKQEFVSYCFRLNYPTYELRNYWMNWYNNIKCEKYQKISMISIPFNFEKTSRSTNLYWGIWSRKSNFVRGQPKPKMSTRMILRSWSSDTSFLRVKYCKSQLTMSVHHKCSDILKIQFVAEMSHVSLTIGQCVQGGPKTEILKDLAQFNFNKSKK